MEAVQAIPHSIRVKFPHGEFEASGERDAVESQYSQFLAVMEKWPGKIVGANGNGEAPPQTKQASETNGDPIEANWDRAYLRKGDRLSLHVLPKGKTAVGDAIVLLVYGYQSLLRREAVTSVDLMDAAKQSGLRIDRIDRNLPASHSQLLIKGGNGKGSRYSLNNRGLKVAQEMLEQLFD